MTEWKIGDISIIVPVLGFAFFIQLFSAEIVFLSLYGRRERFILRFIPTIAAELVLVWIYYNLEPFLTFVFGGSDSTFAVETVEFIRYIVIISLTIAGMTVCFDEQLPSIIMACTAGYALQHFAYKLQTFVGAFFSIYDAVGRSYLLFSLVSTLIFFIPSYIIAWFIFVNPIRKNKWDYNGSSFLNVCSFLIVLLLVFINRFSDNSTPSPGYYKQSLRNDVQRVCSYHSIRRVSLVAIKNRTCDYAGCIAGKRKTV